jgi:uncharacterized protein
MTATAFAPRNSEHKIRPLFLADWRDALFIHFRVDPRRLQPMIPLPLELRDGHAYVSLVAFTQNRLRPSIGGTAVEFLSRPLAHHEFLNLRTYVDHAGEPGIYFISEWIPNPLAALLGPHLYGLPYKLADLAYHTAPGYTMRQVKAGGHFSCVANWNQTEVAAPSHIGSESEFLVERYTAFTARHRKIRRFEIEHIPWPIVETQVSIIRRDLLGNIPIAEPCSAQYSAGLRDVRISLPMKGRR